MLVKCVSMSKFLYFPNNTIKNKPSILYTVCIFNSASLWELHAGALDALEGNQYWEEFWSQLQDQGSRTNLEGETNEFLRVETRSINSQE